MDIRRLKKRLSVEQIINITIGLGADIVHSNNENIVLFRTICHGGDSHKLYFYKDNKEFHCYTNCGQMDIVGLVCNTLGIEVPQAISYICETLGISDDYSMEVGFSDEETNLSLDWQFLNSINNNRKVDLSREFKFYDENILNRFYRFYHPSFYEDGISIRTLYKFGIRYDILNYRVIIPHYHEGGGLIAVRCRNLDEDLVEQGYKYMPISIDRRLISAKVTKYLYGLNFNKENIRKAKKVILFEAEKSVMQLDTILKGNNISVALMSSSLSLIQVEMLKELGVEEVIIALDKEYEVYGSKEEKLYARKVRKAIIEKLIPYFSVSVIWDKEENLLGYKDSPTDRGEGVFNKLFSQRIKI